MPDYLLPCPCGQKHRVGPAQAGDSVICSCGNKLAVPTLRGLRDLEPAPPIASTTAPAAWTLAHGIAFSSGLALAAAAIAVLAFFGLRYAQLHFHPVSRDVTKEAVAYEQERIDDLTPLAALAEWNENLKEGLGQPQEPPWVRANKLLAGYKIWINISLIALVTGVVLSSATLALARR
jgi:hypothetical protein